MMTKQKAKQTTRPPHTELLVMGVMIVDVMAADDDDDE